MDKYKPIDLDNVETYSLETRYNKVSMEGFGKPYQPGWSLEEFINSLPDILAGRNLKEIISRLVYALNNKKAIIFGMGAHVIKCGINPMIIQLIKQKMVTGITLNGAGVIHDVELAYSGKTSENVDEQLKNGKFGMVRETSQLITSAVVDGNTKKVGIGYSVGEKIVLENLPNKSVSILANAYEHGIPVTVHVAIGTDIIHMHPRFDGAAFGEASHLDFRIFCSLVKGLEDGGVFLNIGSAVIIPEVFLKAVSVVRNLGNPLTKFTTINMDFIQQYRPMENVVKRPTALGGKGYSIIGHHEIMLPLLIAGYSEAARRKKGTSAVT